MPIFDTNIMIDYLRGKNRADDIINKYSNGNTPAISSVTCYELVKGLKGVNERELLDLLFDRVKIYSLDLQSAKIAGSMQIDAMGRGRQLSDGDALMIGIAIANDEVLVTHDSDFADLGRDKVVIV